MDSLATLLVANEGYYFSVSEPFKMHVLKNMFDVCAFLEVIILINALVSWSLLKLSLILVRVSQES